MSLRDAIAALVSAAPPDATIPVRWLAEQIAQDDTGASAPRKLDDVTVDLTVPQLAARFGRGPSTIRTWCENGHLPGAYRLNGREWRVPASGVDAMQRTAAARQRPGKAPTLPKATDIGAWREHVPTRQSKRAS